MNLENPNPIIHKKTQKIENFQRKADEFDENIDDPVDSLEVFDIIKDINDPEHPLTLEQLDIVSPEFITVLNNIINVQFKPTIPHCSVANLIGLMIRVKLDRSISEKFKINIKIMPGTHVSEKEINRQLADKERVAAATENNGLLRIINKNIMNIL